MKNEHQREDKGHGLLPLPPNPGKRKDISHAVVFGVLGANELPTGDFDVATPLKIKDQKDLDFCTAFASTEITEDQELEEMDPLFQFAAIKKVMGEFTSYGADLRSAGLALVNFGSLPQRLAPYRIGEKTRDFLANWKNYPADLWVRAQPFKKKTMFFVGGPHDLYGNIIMTLWQNRQEKRSVLLGVLWRKSWTYAPGGVIPETGWENEPGEGHCIKGFGQAIKDGKETLKIQNSWGEDVGDRGIFYFPRSVVNSQFGPFGQITFKDMDPEDAHYYNENNISLNDNWIVQLLKIFANILSELFIKLKSKVYGQ